MNSTVSSSSLIAVITAMFDCGTGTSIAGTVFSSTRRRGIILDESRSRYCTGISPCGATSWVVRKIQMMLLFPRAYHCISIPVAVMISK